MTTLPHEKYQLGEVAERWSRGQALRQQAYEVATETMLDLANVHVGSRVLDVAAGTGEQTLMAAGRAGPSGYVLATDLSASMLSLAAEAARRAGLTNVETRVMDAESLDLNPDLFDAVICRLGLMLCRNRAKALTGMRRVVKPGGKVAAFVFSALEKNPYYEIPIAIVRRLGNIPPPAPGEPWMFDLGGSGVLEETFNRTGFVTVSVHAVPIRRCFPSAADAIQSMRSSAVAVRDLMSRLNDADRELAWAEIEQQFLRFESPSGFEVPGEVLIGVGTK